jgi:hypothetical protein
MANCPNFRKRTPVQAMRVVGAPTDPASCEGRRLYGRRHIDAIMMCVLISKSDRITEENDNGV